MFRKGSISSPSLEDSFFPLSLTLPSSMSSTGSINSGGEIETDLILAAELGRALLEKNEELEASLKQKEKEMEALQQEKHVLQRKMEMNELASGQREAELTADLAASRAELEKRRNKGRDRRKDESEQMSQLANHNQRLVEQLAENRVLLERLSRLEAQIKTSEEGNQRIRLEREGLRERVSDLQMKLKEKEAEIEQEQGVVFELRTLNRSLQEKSLNLGGEIILDSSYTQPMSLLSEIQQSQAKEALLAHSAVLQARDKEIQALKEQLQNHKEELESLREETQLFRSSPEKPTYSSIERELAMVRQEKESLTQQLLNTIKQKVAMSQELEAWQEDMRLVISQQVQQREKERQKDKDRTVGLQRSKSLKMKGDGGKGFLSFFKDI
ncbi:BICD family-like cargo adapter 2 isoform 2-T2 [Pholidichthys leucotaenia]